MADSRAIRVLCIEDDAGTARLLQKGLQRKGYVVDVAGDGEEGLAMLDAGSYDFLLTDHQMPGRSGLDIIRTLAARESLPPTIMVAGHGDERVAVEAMKLGAADYLIKDVDGRYLELAPFVIEQVLHRQHLIAEHKRLEEALRQSEEQFRQSQKMEAVGRLAGGVAHDFNNLLTSITCSGSLLLDKLDGQDPLRADVEEIMKAAKRAATLTRQLLAFSRKQAIQPQVLDLNILVADMGKMLRRLIGGDIELVTALEPALGRVQANPGQIEQVVMNLAVNARDAMPQGGKLTIKTGIVTLDEKYCQVFPEARPGRFVCLSVVDTGVGMDREIIPHIFEPFFSTKKDGSGLGLAVVYGIVKQHEGWVNVYSEPDRGSIFKVYLPTFPIEPEAEETISLQGLQGSGERILLVEDNGEIREFITRTLDENGYFILKAENAQEALDIFEREGRKFHLIFSDVVLPDQTGLQLVDQLLSRNPELPVLLSSGYTDRKSQWSAIRERGFRFLQKPYTLPDLLRAIREAMPIEGAG